MRNMMIVFVLLLTITACSNDKKDVQTIIGVPSVPDINDSAKIPPALPQL